MKTKLTFFLAWLHLAFAAAVHALTFGETADRLFWSSDGSTVDIQQYHGPGGAVTVPATINVGSDSSPVSLPVTRIESQAFANSSVTSVTVPNSVTSIGQEAFYYCTLLTSFTIPNGITSIEFRTFGNCSSLTTVTIPNSVTTIGNSAFFNCANIPSVTIPNSVTSIGAYALQSCSSLANVTIPNSVTSIGPVAFYNCTKLTSVTIPSSITRIGDTAFNTCYRLTSAIFLGNAPSMGARVFYSAGPGFTVYYDCAVATGFTSPTWLGYPTQCKSTAALVVTANPTNGGTVTGEGNYAPGSQQQI